MQQRLYFLGIGGTLMGSLALLAKEMGHLVSGSDKSHLSAHVRPACCSRNRGP